MLGIYQILNLVNAKFYIGSATDFNLRWSQHKWELKNNCHGNTHLQFAWNKYGESSFEFIIIEICDKDKLLEREQFWIDNLKACELGYNIRQTAKSNLGLKWTDAHKEKISKAKRGTIQDQATVDARNAVNRKINIWPHLLGCRCKCQECRTTKRIQRIQTYKHKF